VSVLLVIDEFYCDVSYLFCISPTAFSLFLRDNVRSNLLVPSYPLIDYVFEKLYRVPTGICTCLAFGV